MSGIRGLEASLDKGPGQRVNYCMGFTFAVHIGWLF